MIETKDDVTISNTKEEDQKENKKVIIYSSISFGIIALLILLGVLLLILLGRNNSKNSALPTGNSYSYSLNAGNLTSTSSLETDGSFIYTSAADSSNAYYVKITLSSSSNSELGSYVEKDYIYSAFGGIENTLNIKYDAYEVNGNQIVTSLTDTIISVFLGDKLNNYEIDASKYNWDKQNNLVSISSNEEIQLFSFSISFNI